MLIDPVNDLYVVVSVSRQKVQEDVSQKFTSSAWSSYREVNSFIEHAETSTFFCMYSTETTRR